ncbi:MAG: ABC transporter permease [Candidatus Acidiferrales bacterium]|jgi:putative ABC transport system permease protein
MFGRLLWKMLRGNRGRLAVALLSIASGAAVISALLNLQFDIERKLTQEFRTLGANIVIAPQSGAQTVDLANAGGAAASVPVLMNESAVEAGLEANRTPDVVASAPFLFIVARAKDEPVVTAGTWLDQARKLNPTWKLEGNWIASHEDETQCLVGRNVAQRFQVGPGGALTLSYLGRSAQFHVAGVIDSGAAEDSQIFVNLPVAWKLAGTPGGIGLWQLSVSGTGKSIGEYAARLASALPGYDVRPIRQVTEAEGNLLNRTRLLIASMVVLILVLTALCVLATMAALAMERRVDVGLMKALGGSISRIVGLFLAEVSVLGAAGGLIGCVAGILLAQWMGQRVFGTAITPRWDIFPLTIAIMVGVALTGALPLRLLGKVKPAVILRGE